MRTFKKKALPLEEVYNGKIYVKNEEATTLLNTIGYDSLKKKMRRSKSFAIIISVLPKELIGKLDTNSNPYKAELFVFTQKK